MATARTLAALVFAALLGSVDTARAASILIDDSDVNNVSIVVEGFETFFLNGNPLANNTALVLPDTGYVIDGSWLANTKDSTLSDFELFFAFTGSPTEVTSGVEFVWSVSSQVGSIVSGSFGGLTGFPYFFSSPTFDQNGPMHVEFFPNLTVTFVPESVPEPAALLLLGAGLAAVAARRRLKTRA